MSLTNPDHVVTKQRLADFYQGILPYLGAPEVVRPIVYGIHITNSESDPDAKVQYIADAANMTPAHMDFTNDVFDYGSWSNAFFMPKPCMLKYDGTVDYYLDPNDYTKKLDGTASDVANTSYEGNAMMEWPKIWLKIVPDLTQSYQSASIYISNEQVDSEYMDLCFHNSAGQSVDHFYTAIYSGSLINGKIRSLSGQQIVNRTTISQLSSYAEANNPTGSLIWTMETIADIDLITILYMLVFKTTNAQSSLGKGLIDSGSESLIDNFRTGVHNTKGLFYGTNDGTFSTYTNAVKVFGMENWWGFTYRSYLGEVIVNGSIKKKLTYSTEDGSTVTGYNFNGNGYVVSQSGISGSSGSYISKMTFSDKGIIPKETGASDSTYYCDCVWFYSNVTRLPSRAAGLGLKTGLFIKNYGFESTSSAADIGTTISAKPLT